MKNTVTRIFPNSIELKDYLRNKLTNVTIIQPDDPISFKKLLEEVYIVPLFSSEVEAVDTDHDITVTDRIREVINRIVVQMIRSGSTNGKDQNCLSFGFRRKAAKSETILRSHHDIECAYINTVQSLVINQSWQLLLTRIGSNELRSLLNNPLFLRTLNGCFLQLSGPSCNDLVFSKGNPVFLSNKGDKTNGKRKTFPDRNDETAKPFFSVQGKTVIPRGRIFYNISPFDLKGLSNIKSFFQDCIAQLLDGEMSETTKSSFQRLFENVEKRLQEYDFSLALIKFSKSFKGDLPDNEIQAALTVQQSTSSRKSKRRRGCRAGKSHKSRHETQKLPQSQINPPKQPTSSKQAYHPVNIAQIPLIPVGEKLFDRVLQNIGKDVKVQHFETQESTISKEAQLAEATTKKYGTLNSNSMMKLLLKKKRRRAKKGSSSSSISKIQSNPSEILPVFNTATTGENLGIALNSQRRFYTVGREAEASLNNSTVVVENSDVQGLVKTPESEIWTRSIRVEAVSEFVKSIIRHLFPKKEFWGNQHNFSLIMRKIDYYVRLGRHESFTIEQIMHGIRVTEMPIIKEYFTSRIEGYHSAKPTKAQRLQLEKDCMYLSYRIVFWIFHQLVNRFLANAFYITEVEGKGNQLFYFTKKVWRDIVQSHMNSFTDHFIPIIVNEQFLNEQEKMGNVQDAVVSRDLKRARTDPLPTISSNPVPSSLTRSEAQRPTSTIQMLNFEQMLGKRHFNQAPSSMLLNDLITSNNSLASKRNTNAPSHEARISSNHQQFTLNELLLRNLPEIPTNSLRSGPGKRFTSTSDLRNISPKLLHYLRQIPTVRFLPKKNTIRPITNLRNRGNTGRSSSASLEVITNRSLYHVYTVLKAVYDKNRQELNGFSVFGLDEIYQKLCTYKTSIFASVSNSSSCPPLYMMALDLQKCYDHIHVPLLYDILHHVLTGEDFPFEQYFPSLAANIPGPQNELTENVFPEDAATIHRYTVVHTIQSMKRIVVKPIKLVSFHHQILPFEKVGKLIARSYPNSLIHDHVITAKLSVKEMLRLIKLHLFSHVIKMPMNHCFTSEDLRTPRQLLRNPSRRRKTSLRKNKKRKRSRFSSSTVSSFYRVHTHYYTQVRGIPQGSILSPLFCNLYYGFLERLFFNLTNYSSTVSTLSDGFGLHSRETLVIRMIDDYFMVSTKISYLHSIYQIIAKDFLTFGGKIHQQKIQCSFDPDFLNSPVETSLLTAAHQNDLPISNRWIHYCGLRIDCQYLLFEPHFEKLFPTSGDYSYRLYDTITINFLQIGIGFQKSLKQFFRIKCHAIFLDSQMNTHPLLSSQEIKHWLAKNLYLLFLLTAFRGLLYLDKLRRYYFRQLLTESYLYHCIEEVISFAHALICIRTNHSIFRKLSLDDLRNNDDNDNYNHQNEEDALGDVHGWNKNDEIFAFGTCPLSAVEISCLGWKAFKTLSQYHSKVFRSKTSHRLSLETKKVSGSNTLLFHKVSSRYSHELRKLERFYFGDRKSTTTTPIPFMTETTKSSTFLEDLIEQNPAVVIESLLPEKIAQSCDDYFLSKLT